MLTRLVILVALLQTVLVLAAEMLPGAAHRALIASSTAVHHSVRIP